MSVYIDLLLNSDFKEPTNNSREKTNVKHVTRTYETVAYVQ